MCPLRKRRFSTPKNCIFRAGQALEGAQNAAERRPGENFGGTNEPDTRFLRRNAPKTDHVSSSRHRDLSSSARQLVIPATAAAQSFPRPPIALMPPLAGHLVGETTTTTATCRPHGGFSSEGRTTSGSVGVQGMWDTAHACRETTAASARNGRERAGGRTPAPAPARRREPPPAARLRDGLKPAAPGAGK